MVNIFIAYISGIFLMKWRRILFRYGSLACISWWWSMTVNLVSLLLLSSLNISSLYLNGCAEKHAVRKGLEVNYSIMVALYVLHIHVYLHVAMYTSYIFR